MLDKPLVSDYIKNMKTKGNTQMLTTEREELVTYIYEGYKDAFGVKGRHYNFDAMSMDDLRDEADRINRAIEETIAQEKAAEAQALEEFEHLIAETIRYGAGDRETALRWMTQDEEFYHTQDVEHWVWKHGILFTDEGRQLVKELSAIVTFKDY